MNAAQLLLRQQFPEFPGMQDVSIGQTMAFNVCAGEFVQIFCLIIYAFSPIQSGTYDCGLFSIASMAFGVDPCQIKVAWGGTASVLCKEDGTAQILRTRQQETGKERWYWSTCRMPELKGVPMIECTSCSKCYHVDCEAMPDKVLEDSLAEWNCKDCQ